MPKKKAAKKKAAKKKPASKRVPRRDRRVVVMGFKIVPIKADYLVNDPAEARRMFAEGSGVFTAALNPEWPPEKCDDCDRPYDEPRGSRFIVKSVTDLTDGPKV